MLVAGSRLFLSLSPSLLLFFSLFVVVLVVAVVAVFAAVVAVVAVAAVYVFLLLFPPLLTAAEKVSLPRDGTLKLRPPGKEKTARGWLRRAKSQDADSTYFLPWSFSVLVSEE